MNVLAINGSARQDGNTAILLNTVLKELHKEGIETELIQLSGQKIVPCQACWACSGLKNCLHGEDNFYEILEKVKIADGILLGSPVYAANISATMQSFLERAAVVADMNREAKLLRHKVGATVAVARRGGALQTLDAMLHFFLLQEMFVVGSSYWPIAYGQMSGDVLQDQEGLATAKTLGKNMAYLLKTLKERRNEQ